MKLILRMQISWTLHLWPAQGNLLKGKGQTLPTGGIWRRHWGEAGWFVHLHRCGWPVTSRTRHHALMDLAVRSNSRKTVRWDGSLSRCLFAWALAEDSEQRYKAHTYRLARSISDVLRHYGSLTDQSILGQPINYVIFNSCEANIRPGMETLAEILNLWDRLFSFPESSKCEYI